MNTAAPAAAAERDITFFLRRLRQLDHWPELENSHTAMYSTWDRKGGNADGDDFKRVEGDRNILLDTDGPGCVHRIFTGVLSVTAGTRLRVFLDGSATATFDLPVTEFFDYASGPLPYPLVSHKTYPGALFPIPFARHCRIELFNPRQTNWGNYWQVTYTTYASGTPVRTLQWPLSLSEQAELAQTCQAWLRAETVPPPLPKQWTVAKSFSLAPGESATVEVADADRASVVREMYFNRLRAGYPLRLSITWDDDDAPSVDAPLAFFFGPGRVTASYNQAQFSALPLAVNGDEARAFFPMPFARRAVFKLTNSGAAKMDFDFALAVEKLDSLPNNWGKFHAAWTEQFVHGPHWAALPVTGPLNVPVHNVLERELGAGGAGKYVGVLLFVHWPYRGWWGEGDWQIWTDERDWPPSYHGTGSEEYFNSGWCRFDRKAVSGAVENRLPGDVAVYSFHLNDAFQFQKNIRVAVEIWPWEKPADPHQPATWGSTAFWYALPSRPADSLGAPLSLSGL